MGRFEKARRAVEDRVWRPIIYSRSEQGISVQNRFGNIGPLHSVTIHHSAGPRAKTKADAIRLNKQYNQQHANQGWGGIGYHESMDDRGRIYLLRPASWTGAHVGQHNTGNYGIMIHGNYMNYKLNWRQRTALRWRLMKGHKKGLPNLRNLKWRGHQEWSGHSTNACPGVHVMRHLRWLRGNVQ